MGRAQLWAVMILVSLCACKNPLPGADAVARVNGEAITRQTFDELVERNLRRYGGETQALPPGIRARIEEGVLRRMVDDLMVQQRATQEGIAVADAELERYFAEHKQRFRSTQAFEDYLARSDTSEAALKEDLRKSLLRDRLVEKLTGTLQVTDDEVAAYYKDNASHFTDPLRMHVRRLLLRTPQDAGQHRLAAIARQARKLHDEAKRHPKTFAELCKRHSDGPEAEHHGSMGVVTAGRMPELDKLLADGLEAGAISPVTQTAQGLEIYQITDIHKEHQRSLSAEAKAIADALLMRKRNDRRQEVLRSLKEGAKVDILVSFTPPVAEPSTVTGVAKDKP